MNKHKKMLKMIIESINLTKNVKKAQKIPENRKKNGKICEKIEKKTTKKVKKMTIKVQKYDVKTMKNHEKTPKKHKFELQN